MPEICGCEIETVRVDDEYGFCMEHKLIRCPLHARAAEMRKLLDDLVDAIEHEMEVSDTAVLPNVITQLAQARALLEETR